MVAVAAVAGLLAALFAAFVGARKTLNRDKTVAQAVIRDPEEHTRTDPSTGAVTSIQAADLTMPEGVLDELWTPTNLERLARTYWRFLSRATLGLVRVKYTPGERYVVLLFTPFKLLTFQAPEYEMDGERGVVRWRIEKGVLVARRGHGGDGYLEIDIQRLDCDRPRMARMRIEVEVANFYPAIASGFGQWFYAATQSRIHVLVTYGFLRSLAKLDLAESKVGRFARPDQVPDPQRLPPSERAGAVAEARGPAGADGRAASCGPAAASASWSWSAPSPAGCGSTS